jgi:alkylation response protein AidB-like acyl-CoA dehydrogenase
MDHRLGMTPPIVAAVRRFVEDEVRPVAAALEHADEYPHALVARMRALGLFGALVPAEYGGLGLEVGAYARLIEELCRGWMSLAGVINSHTMAALIVLHHGTDEQRRRLLPRFASGDTRGGLCLTEPHAGSDVQAIRTTARREGDDYVVNGSKMFVTNGREGHVFALLAVTDARAQPRHRGMSCFIVEKGHPGFRVVKSLAKLGYKGVDTVEFFFEDCRVPAANLVGGVEGRGFGQVMSGLETGRINIAARCVGVAQAAYEEALGRARAEGAAPPALADLATGVEAARLITYWAAGMKDRRERCDLEAGMAKLYASETAHAVAVGAMRVHGEAGILQRHGVERHYRDTPLMIIGEGTNEIQRTLIARQLVQRHGERLGALTSRQGEPEERRQIVLAVRQFVDKSLAPVAAEHELAGRYPAALVSGLAELGLLGAVVDPGRGGLGLDLVATAMLLEEVARGWTTVAAAVAGHLVATWALERFAPAAEREARLPALARAERLATTVLGGALAARRDGGEWALEGATALADNAPRGDAFLVRAVADGTRPLLAVVDRDAPGLRRGEPQATLGSRGLDPCVLQMNDVRPALVLEGDAAARVVGAACVMAAAIAIGLAQAAFEAALRYSQQRTAFGQPLCQHQAVQLKLADMATAITAARLLTYRAAEDDALDPVAGAMARLAAARVAADATLESMRIHGGYGYVSEFPVERFYRDAARLPFMPFDDDTLRRHVVARVAGRA